MKGALTRYSETQIHLESMVVSLGMVLVVLVAHAANREETLGQDDSTDEAAAIKPSWELLSS